MRDLYKTLQICATEDAMDYCPEFDAVKAILEYCDKHVKPFKKLVFRSGNELIINELTRRLNDLFVERQLVDPDNGTPFPHTHQKLRKILMFLFVNTDTTYKYNLREDPNYVHLIEICPLLPKFLTVALVWDLQLENFFFEALTYTPCWFAFQYFEAAIESLKHVDDANKVLSMIEQLLRALLTNIERSTKIQMDAIDQKIIFNKLYDQAAILLQRFNTPDANVIEKMKKRQLYRYCGHQVKHLLQTILFAFDLYESKCETSANFDDSVYKIGEAFHKTSYEKIENNRAAKEEELRITTTLLSTLQTSVMNVNMDGFIEWAEVDLTPTLTLQQSVGEMAFKVREHINANKSFEHSVESVLKSIEIRPKSLSEIIQESNIGDILRNLDDSNDMSYETKKLWFDELFNRSEATLGNDECRQTIAQNLKLMTPDNCEKIMDFIKLNEACKDLNEEDDCEDNEELIELLFNALKEFNNDNLLNLLMYQQKTFGVLCEGISADPDSFEQLSTELLNKCTTALDEHEFLLLCFERPKIMWKKFFNLACQVIEHLRHFSETICKTLPYSYAYVDQILKEAVMNPTQPVYFPDVLCELYFILYRNEHKIDFLAKFINDHMKSCLDSEDYNSLLPIIRALNLITQRDDTLNFDELTAPMLAMVAVVADLSRWNLTTFSNARVELVELCISFISKTLSKFNPVATEKDRTWLSNKIKATCMPLTQFYFQSIFCQREEDILSLDHFLCSEERIDQPKAVKFLNKTLVRCISAEFKSLASSTRFSSYVSQAMQQITTNVHSDPHPNAILNLRFCLGEYMNVVNELPRPKCENGKETSELLYIILQLIKAVPDEIYDQIFMDTESLLKDILKSPNNSLSKEQINELSSFVTKMPDCRAKNVFLQTLTDSISSI